MYIYVNECIYITVEILHIYHKMLFENKAEIFIINIARYREKKINMEICHLYQNDFEIVAFQLISYSNEIKWLYIGGYNKYQGSRVRGLRYTHRY